MKPVIPGLMLIVFLFACNTAPTPVPFPEQDQAASPHQEKLLMFEPETIEWKFLPKDSLQPPIVKRLNIDEIPATAFSGLNALPLKKSPVIKKLIWEDLPDSSFSLEQIPSQPLRFKTGILGNPQKVKAGLPRLKDRASENLLMLGQDQGLPGTVVAGFAQDNNGFMWIGTDNGLCRFDGEYFETYSHLQGLGGDYKYRLIVDKKGQIWSNPIAPSNGFEILDPRTKTVKILNAELGLSHDRVSNMAMDKEGRIWASTLSGISLIDEERGILKKISHGQGLHGKLVENILCDSRGLIWVGLPEVGIDVIDESKNKITHIQASAALPDNLLKVISEDPRGRIWIGTKSGISIIDKEQGIVKIITDQHGLHTGIAVTGILFDKLGLAWIISEGGGINVFDPEKETIRHISAQQGLGNDDVKAIFADRLGQIWVGTWAGEINIYNPNAGNLQHITSANGLNNKAAWLYSFAEDQKKRKWIGTLGEGLDILYEDKKEIRHLSTQNYLGSNEIPEIKVDGKHRIWLSSRYDDKYFSMIDPARNTISWYGKSQGFGLLGSPRFCFANDGSIWISKGKLSLYNESSEDMKIILGPEHISKVFINVMVTDKHGTLWAATEQGLFFIDSAKQQVTKVKNKILSETSIQSIIIDSRGLIWLSSYGNGVLMLDRKKGLLSQFSINEGLADKLTLTVIERNGLIYVGTGKGLSVLTPVKENDAKDSSENIQWIVRSYGKPQGFLRVDHNPNAYLYSDGKLWFGIADVITVMNEISIDSMVSSPVITGLDIMEQPQYFDNRDWRSSRLKTNDSLWSIAKDTFYTSSTLPADTGYLYSNYIAWDSIDIEGLPYGLELPYKSNHLTFHFTGARLDNLNKSRYRYILEGNDDRWSSIADRSFADYRNIPPGRYNFKVASMGMNGIWSKPAVFSFTVLPPWWRSGWMYGFYGLCLTGLIFVADKFQRRRLLNKEKEKSRMKELAQAKEIEKAYHELKTTQAQLIQSEKMASLGELTAGIAHEIQNPLNFVNNFSEVNNELLSEMKSAIDSGDTKELKSIAEDLESNMEKITWHGKRADGIVKSMMLHSRSGPAQKEPTDINNLADEYLRLSYHGNRARDKSFNATIKTDFDDSIGKVPVIAPELGRVLLNIYNNAFYAVQEQKKKLADGYEPAVEVATKKNGDTLELTIRDNGGGISEKLQDKIFQPFFTTKPAGQGTGLGLSLSYDIVKMHQGELIVDSTEGKGTTFIIRLPVNG